MRRTTFASASILVLLVACGDDGGSGGAGGGGTGAAGSTTTVSSSSAGGAGGAGAGTSVGGAGGEGGSYEGVNPLDGAPAVELVQGGFGFTEGTVWIPALGVLRFSDIPGNRIHEYDPSTDTVSVWREPSGNTNGNALTPDGDLVMCEHSGRRLSRSVAAGTPAPVAVVTTYQGDVFNSPNDAIVRSDGQIYFTDPTYGLGNQSPDLAFRGVFRVDAQGGVHLVDDDYDQPNGIALSPDESKLYVSDSAAGDVFVYEVAPDGSTGPRALFVDLGPSDGMAVDDAGNLYFTTANGVEVFADDGTAWGTIAFPERPANCAFGDTDRRTLYVTARTGLYRVRLAIPGMP
jgi:gluconolactonase